MLQTFNPKKMFLEIFCSQMLTFEISETVITKIEEIQVFCGLMKIKPSLMQLKIAFYVW